MTVPPPPPQEPSGQPYGTPPPPPPGGGYGSPAGGPPPAPGQGAGGYGTPPQPGPANPYSPWEKRALGAIIDWLVQGVPTWIIYIIAGAIGGALGALLWLAAIALGVVIWVWNVGKLQGETGQSVGKGIVGITLIGEQTQRPIGIGLSLVRSIAHVIDAIPCYIGFLWPLWDAKRQTFADKIMTTVVVPGPTKSLQEQLPF